VTGVEELSDKRNSSRIWVTKNCYSSCATTAYWQWCVQSVFVESESQALWIQSRVWVIENYVESELRVITWSSRVTRIVEALLVIGLQARVNVESHEILRFFYDIFLLRNGTQNAIKWRPIS